MTDVGRWQESIAALPDKQFFNIMRLYLGEIKTPYNKQRLIEQLASFIRREENVKSIITFLDSFDLELITAISLISKVDIYTLSNFFAGTYSITELYPAVLNLTERLLIYIENDLQSGKDYIHVNPFLKEYLKPYINTKLLFPPFEITNHSTEDIFILTPNILISFISYLKVKGISCKADGLIKKNDMKNLSEIFNGKEKLIQLLMDGFINLSLVVEKDKVYRIREDRLKAFAQLKESQQYALLCAASVSRFSFEGLRKEAILLEDCLSSIPDSGFTRQEILRLAFLVGSYTEDGSAVAKKSRFSMMMEEAAREEADSQGDSSESADPQQNANLLDRMTDSAIEFGLLKKLGTTEDGEDIFTKGSLILPEDVDNITEENRPKVVNIDSIFMITIMPGLPLSQLLPLTAFMMIKKCGVVAEFEISRNSASSSYDDGWTPDTITEELKKNTYYDVPQSLKINLVEWYNTYSSAVIYKGYVLKVDESNISFVENNPNIKKRIKEKLADGIYLLNIPAESDISDFLKNCGLDFLGKVKSASIESESIKFPTLRDGKRVNIFDNNQEEIKPVSIQDAAEKLKTLKAKLEEMDLNKNEKESLNYRISNRLILTEEQLTNASIRAEILEADGMDFAGKVHLIEAAIQDDDKLELTYSQYSGKGWNTVTGKALSISKQENEVIMRFQHSFSDIIETILVSKITFIRRLRF